MRRRVAVAICLLLSQSAFPIGRIGNNQSIGDSSERYSVAVPDRFASISAVDDGGVVLSSGLTAIDPMLPIEIQVLPFRAQYPTLKGMLAIENFFLKVSGMRYRKLPISNGGLNMMGESDTSYAGLSVCGDGRGFVMFANKSEFVEQGVLDLLKKTVFEQPCLP